jgi:hypothetical protein
MMEFWNSLGSVGHLAIYAGLMSILAVIFTPLAKKGGVVGAIFGLLLKIVDFFSANLKHDAPPKP